MKRFFWTALCGLSLLGCDDGEVKIGDAPDLMADANTPITDMGSQPYDTQVRPDIPDMGPLDPQAAITKVEETERWTIPGLTAPVQIVRTEMNVPHIYAENKLDLGRALGFTTARDRFFVMDLQRRLGLGTLTQLLGDLALDNDIEARSTGMTYVAERLVENLSPEMGAYFDAVAGGINAYIEEVRAGNLPAPSELVVAAPFLGAASPIDLMHPWDREGLAAMVAVIMYQTNFETGDVGRTAAAQALGDLYADPDTYQAELRREGYLADLWWDVTPLFPTAQSAAGLGIERADGLQQGPAPDRMRVRRQRPEIRPVPTRLVQRLAARLQHLDLRINRDRASGFGSNAWAVAGSKTANGETLVAGDGHLQLSVPALMYQVGLDTKLFGEGDMRQMGLLLTGLPLMAIGTNGDVAWSQTNPVFDITDWYREEIQLDAVGLPEASLFQGEWQPLVQFDEAYEISDIPALMSVGRTETLPRWTTFDGRWLTAIEGRPMEEGVELGDGESTINVMGSVIIPGDVDGDGTITAISFDYTAFDTTKWIEALDAFGQSHTVAEMQEASRGLVGGGLLTAGGDRHGDVLFSSYQAVPCRSHLRDVDGAWLPGGDPTLLIDGTRFGSFSIPTDAQGHVAQPGAEDPSTCVIPFESVPQAVTPAKGYVYTANNDVGMLTVDGSLEDDPWYIGGPWASARGHAIDRGIQNAIEAGADVASMSALQGNHESPLGELFVPPLLAAIELAKSAPESPWQERLAAIYALEPALIDETFQILTDWQGAGYPAESGVETFYHQPTEANRAAAVATMIFNAWFPRFRSAIFDDEGLDGKWRFSSGHRSVAGMRRFVEGRGADNSMSLVSHNPETNESIFFDRLGTEAVEHSEELMVQALVDALAFLQSDPEGPGEGGFGTDQTRMWLWGLRHQVEFKSLLLTFLGDDPTFGLILNRFAITTAQLPLADALANDDPRKGLKHFPRPGDQWNIDAGNPGFSGTRFTHKNGPVMRMVIGLSEEGVHGVNILPGGQSAILQSPHYLDQARLWLANETLPMRFTPLEVAAGATGREVLVPE